MSWNEVLAADSPVLSSPKAYQVAPTLTMPSPCIWSGCPFWSVHGAPGVKVTVAAAAGIAGIRTLTSPAIATIRTPALRRILFAAASGCQVDIALSFPRRCCRYGRDTAVRPAGRRFAGAGVRVVQALARVAASAWMF